MFCSTEYVVFLSIVDIESAKQVQKIHLTERKANTIVIFLDKNKRLKTEYIEC